ncbi:hypothetical protein CANARDRAFT_6848 [[Candida] arabinofermentans NRRL YB-2248]|uniref:PH domain-containing protein n=1 Tax=[Candida] arabinofermentans NRRL YB-2248 TaxID=983967 RepID=A0A1E4T3Y1_9ASCO|nr:hypothetical protein CANARDRAFT_6848 [[Candida] arabinofermentans NRRL YB-2248]
MSSIRPESIRRSLSDGNDYYDENSNSNLNSNSPLYDTSNNLLLNNKSILPQDNYNSPFYIPFKTNDEPKPVDKLINRFTIWKMIIKQLIFYFKEMSIFKKQTYLGNKAMLENLELLKRQTSGKLKSKLNKSGIDQQQNNTSNNIGGGGVGAGAGNFNEINNLNKFIQSSFLPVGDLSILSISTTLWNYHNNLIEKELNTHSQLTLKIIPRLENLKDSLNETIKQIASLKNSSDFKIKDLKFEIAKTGAIMADYIESVELLTKGETKTSLGTTINFKKLNPKKDPYLLRLKLDLQLKDQLYTEAHLKESYYDLQLKSVQLENILYTEVQNCIRTFITLINTELDSVKDNLISEFMNGFLKNDYGLDWDYFIMNDNSKNLLNIDSKNSLNKNKQIRKKSDIIYPYQKDRISCCLLNGYLEKKSKYLKNYSKFFYVLTFNFIHEFKTDDRKKEKNPQNSYSLDDLKVSTSNDDPKKFIVRINSNNNNNGNGNGDSKSKFTFKCPNEEIANKWIDYLTDLTSIGNTLLRNNPNNDLFISVPSQQQSMVNLQQYNNDNYSLRDDFSTFTGSTNESSSSQLRNQLSNNHSSSSLHLPMFHSVKQHQLQQQQQQQLLSEPISPNSSSSFSDALHVHKKSSSASSLPSMRNLYSTTTIQKSSGGGGSGSTTPNSEIMSLHSPSSPQYITTNTGTKIVINLPDSSSSPNNNNEESSSGDYFNYVAPRPRVSHHLSNSSSTPPLLVPTRTNSPINRQLPQQQQQLQRSVTPVYRQQKNSPPLNTTGSTGNIAISPGSSFQKVTITKPKSGNSTPLSGPSTTSTSTTTSTSQIQTPSMTKLAQPQISRREKLEAQMKKTAQSGSYNSISGVFLQLSDKEKGFGGYAHNLPQTPGFLPSNSIGDVFPGGSGGGSGGSQQRGGYSQASSPSSPPVVQSTNTDSETESTYTN